MLINTVWIGIIPLRIAKLSHVNEDVEMKGKINDALKVGKLFIMY